MNEDNLARKSFIKGALFGALVVLVMTCMTACQVREWMGMKKDGNVIDANTEKKIDGLYQLVNTHYMGEWDEEKLREGMLKGLISGLDDPYSVYFDEDETKEMMEFTRGEYEGIGAVLSQSLDTGLIMISQIYEGSPASEAGLKEEDILYKVDDEEVANRTLDDVVSDIRGEGGTKVRITVIRGKNAEEISMTVTRKKLEYQTVDYRMIDEETGYIRIREFDSVTYNQFVSAFENLSEQGMKKIIYDLRGNPGGNLETVCEILDEILPEGLIVSMEDKYGAREEMTSDEERQQNLPMVLLVNGYSASAAEIFAGAIQDYQKGTLVGTTTYGKGVVQQIIDLKDGTAVKLTISEYFTPKGRNINQIGIDPDVEVEFERDTDNEDADNQLDKAVEILKTKS